MPENTSAPSTAALTVFRLAALFTVLAVAMGAVVCATGSGASCPTWPGCRPDNITPQWELSPVIEFTHRVTSGIDVALVAVLVWWAFRAFPRRHAVTWLLVSRYIPRSGVKFSPRDTALPRP